MELHTLNAKMRQPNGKGPARRIRRTGDVPVVLYGGDKDTVALVLNRKEFEKILHGKGGEHAVVQLVVEDKQEWSSPALVKDVQHHPVRGEIIHADFLRIRLDERITTFVPIVLRGQAKGVVEGGVLDHQLRELEVECLALEVPDEIVVDVTELSMGDSVHVSDIQPPPNVTIVTEPDRTVVAVHTPRIVKEAAAAAETAGEPALVGEEAEQGGETEGEEKE